MQLSTLKNALFKVSQFLLKRESSELRSLRFPRSTLRYPHSPFPREKARPRFLSKRNNETSARRKMETAIVRNRCDQYPPAAYTLALLGMKINSPRGLFRFHSVLLIVLRASDILSAQPRPRDRSLNRLDAIFIVHYSATESSRDNIKAVIFRIRLLFLLYIYKYIIYIYTCICIRGNEATILFSRDQGVLGCCWRKTVRKVRASTVPY